MVLDSQADKVIYETAFQEQVYSIGNGRRVNNVVI